MSHDGPRITLPQGSLSVSSPSGLRIRLTGRPVNPAEPFNGVDFQAPTAFIKFGTTPKRPE